MNLSQIQDYFQTRFSQFGEEAQGVDWNSPYAQHTRFDQLLKIIQPEKPYTFLDYGCGYGEMINYMRAKGFFPLHYYGFDIVEEAIFSAKRKFEGQSDINFISDREQIPFCDYTVASGVFNICLGHTRDEWTAYVLESIQEINQKSRRGFAINFLTSYSDPERMEERKDLYFADPCFLFDYCRRNLSRNVAILHDYKIWDFTLLVRKENDL